MFIFLSLSLGAGDLAFSATGTYAFLVSLMGIARLCEVEHITWRNVSVLYSEMSAVILVWKVLVGIVCVRAVERTSRPQKCL